MKRLSSFFAILAALAGIGLATLIPAQSQSTGVPYFPQTLPASTVVGRLSTGPGPTEAIPFSNFSTALIAAIVPITGVNGGTGINTAAIGDLLYASATTPTWARLADVATGSVLVSGGVSTAPAWSTSPTLTAVTATTGTIATAAITTGTCTTCTITTATITTANTTAIVGAAGSTSIAPITLTAGTNLTTAAAGAVEFDGTAFYATSAASSRQVVAAEQICVLTANYTLSNVNTAQKAFNCSTNGSVTLAASTSYYFEAQYLITNTGTTSHTWGVLLGGAATFTSVAYEARAHTSTGNVLTATSDIYSTAATILVVTAASTSATENVTIGLTGIMRVNAGGTVIPQVQLSAATGTAATMLANSYFKLYPIGSNTVATVGNWN